jgi:TRAP-type C4-dicarboxylate transport system permease large subunit
MMKIAGMVLIVLGIAALIYGGFTYSSQKDVVSIGGMQISTTENHTIPISPILGVVAIAGGAGLLYFKVRKGY